MAEHARVKDFAGNEYQWVDAELVMLIDIKSGEPRVFGPRQETVGTLEEAMRIASTSPDVPPSFVIVKLRCIAPYRITVTKRKKKT